jgi:hypothetical protein
MPICSICGEEIRDGSRTCSMCGTAVEEMVFEVVEAVATPESAPLPTELPPGGSYCPVCMRVYEEDWIDSFCMCGTELLKELPGAVEEIPMAPMLDEEVPMAPMLDEEVPEVLILDESAVEAAVAPDPVMEEPPAAPVKIRLSKPSPGTPCLVLYGPDRQPLQYFALTKDTMLIGRLDAVAGNFPDIDLDEWFDRATIRKISRQHALILRSRATKTFSLRPLLGNTGTQLEGNMVGPQQDFPLQPGHRIILGGVVRLKFEIA